MSKPTRSPESKWRESKLPLDNNAMIAPHNSSPVPIHAEGKRGRPATKRHEIVEEILPCTTTNCFLCANGPPTYFHESVPTWADILQVILFGLAQNHQDKPFFSLSSDIYPFVSSHLKVLGCEKYIGTNWKQTVKMTLSHARYSHLFENGYDTYFKTGLWRVKQDIHPYKNTTRTGQSKKKRSRSSSLLQPPKKKPKLEKDSLTSEETQSEENSISELPPTALQNVEHRPDQQTINIKNPKKNDIKVLLVNEEIDTDYNNKMTKLFMEEVFSKQTEVSDTKEDIHITELEIDLNDKCEQCQIYQKQIQVLNKTLEEKDKVIEHYKNENNNLKLILQKINSK